MNKFTLELHFLPLKYIYDQFCLTETRVLLKSMLAVCNVEKSITMSAFKHILSLLILFL